MCWRSRPRSGRHAISAQKKRVSCARQLRVSEGGTRRPHSRSPRVAERLRHVWADDHRAELAITTEIQEGRAAEVILECAAVLPTDLIAIGARGLSAPSAFRLGTTAHKVAAHAG